MSKRLAFATFDQNGFELDTFYARSRADVERAVALEWGREAEKIRIERFPISTIRGDEPRFADLTTNSGWAALNAGEIE